MILTALFKNWGPALGLFGTIRGERMENSGTMLSNDDHKTSKAVLDQARETKAHWTRSWSSPKERILSRKSSSSKTTVKDDCGVDMAKGELVKGRRPPFQRLRIFIVRSLYEAVPNIIHLMHVWVWEFDPKCGMCHPQMLDIRVTTRHRKSRRNEIKHEWKGIKLVVIFHERDKKSSTYTNR